MKKCVIIGGGPAGLSCAYYLAEKGYANVTVFEKNKKPGGMMVYGIPSFKLEKNVVEAEIDVIKEMGVEIRCGVEVGKDITLDQMRDEGYKAFYIAIGCQGGRAAGVAGEDAEGVMTAVDFLHKAAEGEAEKLTGRAVVIGGGNAVGRPHSEHNIFGGAFVDADFLRFPYHGRAGFHGGDVFRRTLLLYLHERQR